MSNQSLPEGFGPPPSLQITQINSSLIRLDWTQPRQTHGPLLSYSIYRNSTPLTTSSSNNYVLGPNQLTFFDVPNTQLDNDDDDNENDRFFVPNTVYVYQLYACNEAGCASDNRYYQGVVRTRDVRPVRVEAPKLASLSETRAVLDASESVYLRSNLTQRIVEYRFYVFELLVYRGKESRFELRNLKPFTTYSIALEACTFLSGHIYNLTSLDNKPKMIKNSIITNSFQNITNFFNKTR